MEQVYVALTKYVGMYVCYLLPIAYFSGIIVKSITSSIRQQKPVGGKGIAAITAISVIALDFIRFLYLFLTNTGKLLPAGVLFIKYGLGALMWLWVIWYCYDAHFSRHAAGNLYRKRLTFLASFMIGGAILGGIGIAISS